MDQKKQLYSRIAAGDRIRSRRKQLGLTRKEMAEQIGKAEKYYADIERGYCGMSLDTMIEIADSLGLTLDYLVFGNDGREESERESDSIQLLVRGCDEKRRKKAVELLKKMCIRDRSRSVRNGSMTAICSTEGRW